jgi:hypothetical protein
MSPLGRYVPRKRLRLKGIFSAKGDTLGLLGDQGKSVPHCRSLGGLCREW